jgi:hypothetical protein
MNLSPFWALIVFPAMLICFEIGCQLHARRKGLAGHNAIEGAVFGLFGLLLAFSFSGAVSRYDAHRALLTQERNDIGTAYLLLSLLPQQAQPELRQLFRDYTSSRLHLFDAVGMEVSPETTSLQNLIWQRSISAASAPGANPDATKLLLPALSQMIDITAIRQNAFNMHPPPVIFLLLFLFSCGSAFMAGYSMKVGERDWIYPIALAAAVTLTIYATLEIEFPRQGVIRPVHLDQGLISLRDSMK